MKQKRMFTIMLLAVSMMLTACSGSSGQDVTSAWSNEPVEAIEAVMDTVNLRPYEETGVESDDWKKKFEESLMENYGVTVDHYEDLGDGVYQVYVVIDGKTVPYVTVDSKTGDYHG